MTGTDTGAPGSAQPEPTEQQRWIGPTAPVPIIHPEDKTPRIPHRTDGETPKYPAERMLDLYYHFGEQMYGKLQLRDDGKSVLFQLPETKKPVETKQIQEDESDAQRDARLKAEGVYHDLMDIFFMDEDLGISTFAASEDFHAPVEMPAEQLAASSYEDLIPVGVRSRRSGNERVHPSELRTAHGEAARRARRERELLFSMELSDADDEEEDEDEESELESEVDVNNEDVVEEITAPVQAPVTVEEPLAAGEAAVLSTPVLQTQTPRRSLFTRKTCLVPANAFRSYRMARRELDYIRELALDPTGPRALDDEEFEAVVDTLGLDEDKPDDDVISENDDEEDEEPSSS